MAGNAEYIAPISVDLRTPDWRMDITKGIDDVYAHVRDELLDSSLATSDISLGDWLVLGPNNTLVAPGSTGEYGTYPIWVGNDQFDSMATGKCTLVMGANFSYRTKKFVAGTYTNGMNLTVKSLDNGTLVPSAAGDGDAILARVYKAPDANGVMEIEVLGR